MTTELEMAQMLDEFIDDLNEGVMPRVYELMASGFDGAENLIPLLDFAAQFKVSTVQMPPSEKERVRAQVLEAAQANPATQERYSMTKYPKIETLYVRSKKTFKVEPGQLRCPEFALINRWLITEKIHGTNIRVTLEPSGAVRFGGRTDNAQIPTFLLDVLQDKFPPEKLQEYFEPTDGEWPLVILYGEGYGARIQKGGGNYRDGVSFRLFDVRIGEWWLNWDNVVGIAQALGIKTVPDLAWADYLPRTPADIATFFDIGHKVGSHVAYEEKGLDDIKPEGIVARTDPLLVDRRGSRVIWKLKFKDFA